MNGDVQLSLQLKLQAWVDGELMGDDARQMESLVAGDPQAAALAGELRMTRKFLAGQESERSVPVSRDFYWSRIRREIEQGLTQTEAPVAPAGVVSFWNSLRRLLVPVSGLALVMLVAALSVKYFAPASLEDAVQMIEVENLSDEMASISYRSHADKLFVVYVYPKEKAATEDEGQAESLDDLLFQ